MKALLKEPLLHFLLAGGLLFAVYTWINQDMDNQSRVVRISAAEMNWLTETWTQQRSRQPDEQELRDLVAGYLKEKLLAREARELGLELDDTVVRRRLALKMEFLVQDAASVVEPGEDELHSLYDNNIADYQSLAWISFTQIYFRDKAAALQGLDKLKVHDADELGDSSLLARDFVQADEQVVTSVFGPDFFTSVAALESGRWQGPVASSYGYHLVLVNELRATQPLAFEEVRTRVLEEWQRIQQDRVKQQYFAGLLKKYDFVLDEDVASLLGPLEGIVR